MKHDNSSMGSLFSSNNKSLENLFKELDSNLKKLGCSDSSIEFAPHISKHFENSIDSLNLIKKEEYYI